MQSSPSVFGLALLVFVFVLSSAMPPHAEEAVRRHAIAKVGEPRFPPDFKHFDWVDPDAPKGGVVRQSDVGSFDNLNPFTIKGIPAPGLALINDTLFAPSPDEPATAYAAIAEWASYPDDFSSVTFSIRPGARFNDGQPITPEDVIFSMMEQKRASPSIALYYREVTSAEKTGEREVTFRFSRPGNRDLPLSVSLLQITPKHYWAGKTSRGEPRDITATTFDPPVGAGPYRIKSVDPGRGIVYERVKDWWARDLPVNVGQYNFDEIRYLLYRDDIPEFEALKDGQIDFKVENSSKRWATGYDIPAVHQQRLKKIEFETKSVAQLQGFILNLRRPKFTDPRVRHAFLLAYDFESANKELFYGLYRRINSFFDNSELAQRGLPSARELEILEPLRDKVPPEVFTTEFKCPVYATPADLRRNLGQAARLLDEAGWKLDNGVRRNAKTGEPLTVEFLNYDTSFDRIILPYQANLAKLGIQLVIRIVDPTQYQNRLKVFDFDMITDVYLQSHSPGNEQRERWGSEAADHVASSNRIGIRNPAVDAIIDRVLYARTRDDLIAATRALDRVLLWNYYITPQWYNPTVWYAYWDRFGRPSRYPSQDPSVLTTWWYDANVARKLGAGNGQ